MVWVHLFIDANISQFWGSTAMALPPLGRKSEEAQDGSCQTCSLAIKCVFQWAEYPLEKMFSPLISSTGRQLCVAQDSHVLSSATQVPEPSCLSLPEKPILRLCVCVSVWKGCRIPLSRHGCYIRKHFALTWKVLGFVQCVEFYRVR